jgi:triacylglycerol lipase
LLNRRAFVIAGAAACLVSLSACAGLSPVDLTSIGSEITPVHLNFAEIYSYAQRSSVAYADAATIRRKYPQTVRVKAPGNSSVLYFLERDDRRRIQIITIRGTHNDKNITEDLSFTVRDDRKIAIPVHSGFDRTTRLVYLDVKPHLRPGYKTYVTRHSLGGAVAAILAIYLIEDGFPVERVVTFGQPRFTTTVAVKRLQFLPLTRVVDENDIVPLLPPSDLSDPVFGLYDHVGPEIILLAGSDFVYLPSPDASLLAIGSFWRSLDFANVKDHNIQLYMRRIASKSSDATEIPYIDRLKYLVGKVAGVQR